MTIITYYVYISYVYVDLYYKDELDLHFHFGTINKIGLLW